MTAFEREAESAGYGVVAGTDEAGRGPLAGPVVAAAVILPKEPIEGINDSKKLSEKKREALYDVIMARAVSVGVGYADEREIDEINILNAAMRAMARAVDDLNVRPDFVLIDGNTSRFMEIPHRCIVKGDQKSASVAAASIIAKVTRDRLMAEYAKKYPEYGFEKHKGYPTREHTELIKKYGPCKIHRKTFLKKILP
ncbi:MAG: ribonuclease HII [Clostridia bacterium]|nr:ribonuclease HII [Clostridia bacterium]